MSIDTRHVEWMKDRLRGLVVAIQVEEVIMEKFQHIMDASAITGETDARKARVWIDARRLRDELVREQDALSSVIAEIRLVK